MIELVAIGLELVLAVGVLLFLVLVGRILSDVEIVPIEELPPHIREAIDGESVDSP